jgi:hypothetical protein
LDSIHCQAFHAKGAMMRTLFTIGYEGAALADFVATLQQCEVEHLLDVRSPSHVGAASPRTLWRLRCRKQASATHTSASLVIRKRDEKLLDAAILTLSEASSEDT